MGFYAEKFDLKNNTHWFSIESYFKLKRAL